MSSNLAAQIFDRFITRSGFTGGYHWSSLKKDTAAEFSAAGDSTRLTPPVQADLVEAVLRHQLTVDRVLKIAGRRGRP